MPRQTITANVATGPWGAPPLATEVAANATDKEQTTLMGGKVLITARNSGASSRVVTITSTALGPSNRTGDITATLAAGVSRTFGPFGPDDGFRQSDGMLYFEAAHAEVLYSVIRLP